MHGPRLQFVTSSQPKIKSHNGTGLIMAIMKT